MSFRQDALQTSAITPDIATKATSKSRIDRCSKTYETKRPSSFQLRLRKRRMRHPSNSHSSPRLLAMATTMRETQHRMKNFAAVMISICHQTVRDSTCKAELDKLFSERVEAYCLSLDLMVKNTWRPIDLHRLVDVQLEAFRGEHCAQVVVDGPHIEVSPTIAQNLGLALHELATNAVKFGALSTPSGQVRVAWEVAQVDAQRVVSLAWTEAGGPVPVASEHHGFGSKLTDKLVALAINGTSSHTFGPTGAKWSIAFPYA